MVAVDLLSHPTQPTAIFDDNISYSKVREGFFCESTASDTKTFDSFVCALKDPWNVLSMDIIDGAPLFWTFSWKGEGREALS